MIFVVSGTLPTLDEIYATLADLKAEAEARARRGPETDVMLMDYHTEYLPSKLWAKIKRRVLKRDGKKCQSCGGYGIVVHHRSYEREVLEGNADHLLATVCEGCHNIIHFLEDGTRRPEAEWDAVLLGGQHQTDVSEPKIDLRLQRPIYPTGWSRMTARQHAIWMRLYSIRLCEKHVAKGHKQYERLLRELLLNDREGGHEVQPRTD